MPGKLLQDIVCQVRDSIDRPVGIVDEYFTVVACSDLTQVGAVRAGLSFASPAGGSVTIDGNTYRYIDDDRNSGYAVFIQGDDDFAKHGASMAAVLLRHVMQYFDGRYDKANFVKNVVTENILPSDVYSKAREMHFATDVQRVVLLVRAMQPVDISVLDIVSELFPDKHKDFVFNTSANDTIIVKEIRHGIEGKDIEKLAGSMVDILGSEHYARSVVGIGTVVTNVKDLASSFKEAQVALEVSKVFDSEQTIVSYDNLGIARLIYQLPTTLCEMFLKEVFKKGTIDSLDHETLFTIQRFFENNLNVSETSRGLFVHRNTLVYRLEKIRKLTGLDLREFEHAIVFKVALMVRKYLDSRPVKF